MKKEIFIILLSNPYLLFAKIAKIKIDVSRAIREIDPKIYGVFMEPISFSGTRVGLPDSVRFSTLYGTRYDPASPLVGTDDFLYESVHQNIAMLKEKDVKVDALIVPGGHARMNCKLYQANTLP